MAGHWNIIIDLLKNDPPKICAEVGVYRGRFASQILGRFSEITTYYCIDTWKHYDDFTAILRPQGEMAKCDFNKIFRDFKVKIKPYKSKVKIYRMTSKKAAKLIKDGTLDFVFIDANHAYDYIKEDIGIWLPKVKKGGVISGHDYNVKRFGVTEAVDELLPKANSKKTVWYWRVNG